MWKLALCALALSACALDRDDVGPTVHISLGTSFQTASDTDATPTLELLGDPSYMVSLEIDTEAGTGVQSGKTSTFAVDDFTLTLSAAGLDVPALHPSDFTKRDILDDPRFERADPIVIPASAMGSALTAHLAATDSRGLASNVIELSVALD